MLKFNLIEIIKMGIAAFVTKSILNNRFAPLFWKRLAGYKGYELSSDRKTLILECANALVSVSVFRKNVFRIIVKFNTTKKIPFYDGEYFTFSVESQPISVLEVSETDLNLSISTESESSAIFDKESCCFLLSQKSSCGKENGPERITNVEFSAGRKSWVRIVTQTKQKVSFMGFGQKTRGFFKNHHKMRMWNTDDALLNPKSDPAYQSWPVVLSGNSCGFDGWFFDNPHYQKFKTNTGSRVSRLYASAERGPGCLYWTGGQDPAVVSNNFGCLMGTYRLPPLWVLGHHHSRWEPEESSNRIIGIMKNFRLRKIPCDAVHIDIAHMRGLRCFTWDRSSFPDLEEFIA
ncbi:MAG: hypothetical protein EHM28_00775 [Spirochaetaceae bacterium]|nr:MAG: hypothetical protein EHM28_00775 [Spirochaetaceae bacterium]